MDLVGQTPIPSHVVIAATDEVVRELGEYLQAWADDIGFNFHDAMAAAASSE